MSYTVLFYPTFGDDEIGGIVMKPVVVNDDGRIVQNESISLMDPDECILFAAGFTLGQRVGEEGFDAFYEKSFDNAASE